MKKATRKQLSLKVETVRNLSHKELRNAGGGLEIFPKASVVCLPGVQYNVDQYDPDVSSITSRNHNQVRAL